MYVKGGGRAAEQQCNSPSARGWLHVQIHNFAAGDAVVQIVRRPREKADEGLLRVCSHEERTPLPERVSGQCFHRSVPRLRIGFVHVRPEERHQGGEVGSRSKQDVVLSITSHCYTQRAAAHTNKKRRRSERHQREAGRSHKPTRLKTGAALRLLDTLVGQPESRRNSSELSKGYGQAASGAHVPIRRQGRSYRSSGLSPRASRCAPASAGRSHRGHEKPRRSPATRSGPVSGANRSGA
jgi:hypothetical protein